MEPVTFSIVEAPAMKRTRSIWDVLAEAYRDLSPGKAIAVPVPPGKRHANISASIRKSLMKAGLPTMSSYYDAKTGNLYVIHRPGQAKRKTPDSAATLATHANGAKSRFSHLKGPINPHVVGKESE